LLLCYDACVFGGSKGGAAILVMALVHAPACADVVVGQFDASSGEASDSTSTSTSAPPDSTGPGSTGSSSTEGTGSGTSGAEEGFVPPGCFSDDFEDGVISEALWNAWVEEDASVEEVAGQLKFTPPSLGLFDTGLTGSYLYDFPFDDTTVRLQLGTLPPLDDPSGLFLIVSDDTRVVRLQASGGNLRAVSTDDEVMDYSEVFPAEPYPAWLGIRAEGPTVHFETSEDGETWTTLSSHDPPVPFGASQVLIMAQTFGSNPDQAIISVESVEVCVLP